MNKIAAVVVTYNRKELLKKCIQHILEQTVDSLDIVVIDNGSTDASAKRALYAGAKVLSCDRNKLSI